MKPYFRDALVLIFPVGQGLGSMFLPYSCNFIVFISNFSWTSNLVGPFYFDLVLPLDLIPCVSGLSDVQHLPFCVSLKSSA